MSGQQSNSLSSYYEGLVDDDDDDQSEWVKLHENVQKFNLFSIYLSYLVTCSIFCNFVIFNGIYFVDSAHEPGDKQ